MTERITTSDLLAASEWLEMYEGTEDDPTMLSCHRVAAWLERQVQQRIRHLKRRSLRRAMNRIQSRTD